MTYNEPRFCDVIAFYTGTRRIMKNNKYYINWYAKQLIECIIGYHQNIDAGLYYDTIIVCNRQNTQDELNEAELFLQKYNGIKTKNGKFIVEFRENKGISFGAYNYAYSKYADEYDYFFFTEDDVIFTEKDWYKKIYDKWTNLEKADSNLGFLAAKGVSVSTNTKNIEGTYFIGMHCHGGVGLTSSKNLDLVKHIGAEYFDYEWKNNYKTACQSEVKFTNRFCDIGKNLVAYGDCLYSKFFSNYQSEVGNPPYIGVPKNASKPEDFYLDWDKIKKNW